jgi:hypothetical protein
MKKYTLSILFLLLVALQQINAQQMRFGIIASPGISWFKTDISRIKGDGSKLGINIGLVVDRYFAEHYAFTSGISIQSIGGYLMFREEKILKTSSGDETLTPNTRAKYNLQYVHIPIALKFKTTEIGYMTFFAQLGLNTMINIKARADVDSKNLDGVDISKEISRFYMGYHIGAGVEYKIVGNTALIGGIQYMNGFTDVTTDESEKTLMHGIEFKIGVLF